VFGPFTLQGLVARSRFMPNFCGLSGTYSLRAAELKLPEDTQVTIPIQSINAAENTQAF